MCIPSRQCSEGYLLLYTVMEENLLGIKTHFLSVCPKRREITALGGNLQGIKSQSLSLYPVRRGNVGGGGQGYSVKRVLSVGVSEGGALWDLSRGILPFFHPATPFLTSYPHSFLPSCLPHFSFLFLHHSFLSYLLRSTFSFLLLLPLRLNVSTCFPTHISLLQFCHTPPFFLLLCHSPPSFLPLSLPSSCHTQPSFHTGQHPVPASQPYTALLLPSTPTTIRHLHYSSPYFITHTLPAILSLVTSHSLPSFLSLSFSNHGLHLFT